MAALFIGVQTASAQVDTGTIFGTVSDQSGAVVPGADVTLTNEGTSLSVKITTTSFGGYNFTPLKIGNYTITVEKAGFEKVVHPHIPLQVQEQVKIDITLVPGQVTQTIEVTAAAPLLQTQSASVGQVVGAAQVNDLPLNGRNYTFLAQLVAGVTRSGDTGRGLQETGGISANGLPLVHNNYILDGIDNNNDTVDYLNGASYATLPPPDAIQEFKVQTSNFSAEFGRAGAAVINATIKSGTNQIHGDIWEFVRNDKLDAASFFENSPTHIDKGEFRRNQFGGAVGGPVYIPHLYNGKDKTFFFVDYEGNRIRQAYPRLATVPTATESSSGFTDLQELITEQSGTRTDALNRTFPVGAVFDPATTRSVTMGALDPVTGIVSPATGLVRDPFYSGSLTGMTDFTGASTIGNLNMLPAGRLDSSAMKILGLYPTPSNGNLFNNYTSHGVFGTTINHVDVRMDENFSGKDQLFGRVSVTPATYSGPNVFPGYADGGTYPGNYTEKNFNGGLSETHSFSPSLVNEFRIGYSRLYDNEPQPFSTQAGIPNQFGVQGIPQVPGNGGFGTYDIAGLTSLGSKSFLPGIRGSDTWQVTDNLTKLYGAHTFKGGFEYQDLRHPWFAPAWARGEFDFNGFTDVPYNGGGNTGIAQFLLSPTPTTVPNGFNNVGGADGVYASNFDGPDDIRDYYGAYFQDDWKITSKLTLNLGLRYEFFGSIGENYGAQANFIPNPPGSAEYLINTIRKNTPLSPSFLSTLATEGISLGYSRLPGLVNTPNHDFAPRLGFAYQITPKLVARGAYGFFYGGFEDIGGAPDIGENYPFLYDFSFFAPDQAHPTTFPNGGIATVESGFANIPLSPDQVNAGGLSLQGWQTNYKTPTVYEYNLMFQYAVTTNNSIQVGYLGNGSRHNLVSPGLNQPSIILPPNVSKYQAPYIPFPDFGVGATYVASEGNQYYNSLQTTFQRRLSTGLSLLANYTYSKCRGDYGDLLGVNQGHGFRAPYLAGFGPKGDYALCGEDVTNIVHLSGVYKLPFGSGQHFAHDARGAVNQVIGGWSVNWILTLQGGFPFSIGCPQGTTSDFGCYADLVSGQNKYAGPHNVNQWLNAAAFSNPPVATTIGQTDISPLGGAANQAYGPGFHRMDFSLFKNFQTTERTHIEFRGEIFNLTNTPQFGQPAYTNFLNPSNFGQITSLRDAGDDPRQIQFALKFYW